MRTISLILLLLIVHRLAHAQDASIQKKVDDLLKRMTLEEKVGQLNQYSGRQLTGPQTAYKTNLEEEIKKGMVGSMLNVKGVKDTREVQALAMQSRLKIPLLFGLDVVHGCETTFPVPLAEAASWDMDAIRQSAHVAAVEASSQGIHWTFAPMVDISRDPRWGRIMEGAGEDPYLGSMIARARIKGFQGEKLGNTDAVMACAKHFAAYGAAIAGRDYNSADMSELELWQTYLPPFKAAAEAGAATFMNSFNTLNGIPATGNEYLQRSILKGMWKYKGFVVSDWSSISEMVQWGYAKDSVDAAIKAVTAGCDMDMEGRVYIKNLARLVKDRKVNIKLVDDAVSRILYKKFELGLFDDPYRFSDAVRETEVQTNPQYRAVARDVARKSIVLLKNENAVLPLVNRSNTVALIGPLVKSQRDLSGNWIVNKDSSVNISLWEGMKSISGEERQLLYASGGSVAGSSDAEIAEAVAVAQKSDIVVLAVGETWDMSGESKSRADIHLPGNQTQLFKALQETGKPVVVVVMAGRPLIFNEIADKATAIVYAWWLGTESGNAIADVLSGKYNPSGKLPVSFPQSMGQIPIYYAQNSTGRPYTTQKSKLYLSAYIDESNTPRYAFGHGLSYTQFKYDKLQLSKAAIKSEDSVVVSFELTNTGRYDGEEVAQLYLHQEFASVVRPMKELKAFAKVKLKAGETKRQSFVIGKEQLSFYNRKLDWGTEPGTFQVMIGASSDDIRLNDHFELL